MVVVSENLYRLSQLPVTVPRVLQPRVCPKIKFEKFSIPTENAEIVTIRESGLSPIRLASQLKVFRIGVVFAANSCCASGVNNVLSGLFSYLEESGRLFELVGIVGGPNGLLSTNSTILLKTREQCSRSNNLGGTELLGYGSFRSLDLEEIRNTCVSTLALNGLVIVAASDELAKSVHLANLLYPDVCVVIVPQSRNQHVYIPSGICQTSLGFDSARRSLAELAGNIAVDCISSKKYWHFINVGDAALAGEVALLIRANICVTEHDKDVSFFTWVSRVADLIDHRANVEGIRSGVVMVSQCAFSRSNEMKKLIEEVKAIENFPISEQAARKTISKESFSFLEKLPRHVKSDLLRVRDTQGNPQLSYWSPEEFLVDEVRAELARRRRKGAELACRAHFLAHESRCPVPTAFDCMLGSCLGRTAGALMIQNLHGFMTTMMNMHSPIQSWVPTGVNVCHSESLIEQKGYQFTPPVENALKKLEPIWANQSRYRSFGPLQLSQTPNLYHDDSLVPLTVLADRIGDLSPILDPAIKSDLEPRVLPNTDPIIRLPVRSIPDMSPLEDARRLYEPKIPGYLTDPFTCIDSDLCARVCSNTEQLEKVFPHSHRILPVEIVSTHTTPETLQVDHTDTIDSSPSHSEDSSKDSSRDNDDQEDDDDGRLTIAMSGGPSMSEFPSAIPSPYRPYRVTSPRNSIRTVPPQHSQLIQASCKSLVWKPSDPQFGRSLSIESATRNLQRHITALVPAPPAMTRVGVVFMCSQVPGCHNVVAGLFDYVKASGAGNAELIGFLGGGTGLRNGWYQILTRDLVDVYRNQGGQDLLGHFGENLETHEDMEAAIGTLKSLRIDSLVIVGNLEGQLIGALLTEKLLAMNHSISIITVPASAENEIPFIRQSIGCDTVTRVFANAIANLSTEAHSSRHRWYFVRLMSHHVSHLALEVALATHPNIVLVTEEVAARKQSLAALTEMITDCICRRSAAGKDYGVILIPDGVVSAVPEIRRLLRELDKITAKQLPSMMNFGMRLELIQAQLSRFSSVIFTQLPRFVQAGLINGMRHSETGKIDIANVAMERILQTFVSSELDKRRRLDQFSGQLDILVHALAYQGRSSLPTNFDSDLAYTCGYTAGILVESGRTGLMTNVTYADDVWTVGGLPLTSLVQISRDNKIVSIEPTKLVMTGNACRALFDTMPLPEFREGHQPGPYQFSTGEDWQLSIGNLDTWEAFECISRDCREILGSAGREFVRNSKSVEQVLASLKNIVETVEKMEKKQSSEINNDWFLKEPDDILSTCTPQRGVI